MPKKEDRRESSTKAAPKQGWGAVVKKAKEDAQAREGAENSVRDFWLKDGESAKIQFLQDEPFCYDAHSVKDRKGNWNTVPCQLATHKHCTLCSDGVKLTWRAAFKIIDLRGNWDKDKKRFKNDKPIEKVWKVGSTVAQAIKNQMDKRGKPLTELVLEVTRTGSSTDTSYNFEVAFDDDDQRMKPIKYKEQYATAEELCQPPTDEEIDDRGYESSGD